MSDRKNRISKLRCLVSELSDRDKQLKLDKNMFEDFFSNFPIPVTMWSLDATGNVLSMKGNTVVKEDGTKLEDMFLEKYAGDFKEAHRKAYLGENVSFFSNLSESTYYTRLVPRIIKSRTVGVIGISWDITSNYKILDLLSKIKTLSQSEEGKLKEINLLAQDAIDSSRIKGLLKEND